MYIETTFGYASITDSEDKKRVLVSLSSYPLNVGLSLNKIEATEFARIVAEYANAIEDENG